MAPADYKSIVNKGPIRFKGDRVEKKKKKKKKASSSETKKPDVNNNDDNNPNNPSIHDNPSPKEAASKELTSNDPSKLHHDNDDGADEGKSERRRSKSHAVQEAVEEDEPEGYGVHLTKTERQFNERRKQRVSIWAFMMRLPFRFHLLQNLGECEC